MRGRPPITGLEGLKKYGAEPGWWKPPQTGRDTSFVRLREHSTAAHQTPAVRGIRVVEAASCGPVGRLAPADGWGAALLE